MKKRATSINNNFKPDCPDTISSFVTKKSFNTNNNNPKNTIQMKSEKQQ